MSERELPTVDPDEQRLRNVFGSNVRQLRKTKGYSQMEMATLLDIAVDMVGRLERGTVGASFKTVTRLSKLFDVPEYVFFGYGLQGGFTGDRGRILGQINMHLSKMSDDELDKARKLLAALV